MVRKPANLLCSRAKPANTIPCQVCASALFPLALTNASVVSASLLKRASLSPAGATETASHSARTSSMLAENAMPENNSATTAKDQATYFFMMKPLNLYFYLNYNILSSCNSAQANTIRIHRYHIQTILLTKNS